MVALFCASGARIAAEPSASPRFDWLFNARVAAAARVGDRLFVGGGFTNTAPSSGVLSRFFQLSATTGEPVPGLPAVNGDVSQITPDGAGGYYIAGTFTNIGGAGPGYLGAPSPTRVAHVLANGSDDPAFRPTFGGQITTVVRAGPSLVVAGELYVDGGATLRRLLAVNYVNGGLSPWVPAVAGFVNRMAATGTLLFVLNQETGGIRRVTAFDSATGAVVWSVALGVVPFDGAGALAVVGSRLVVGLDRLYSLDPATGVVDPAWGGPVGASTQIAALSASGSTLYVGGSFAMFHGMPRANLAAVDLATGAVLPWAPQASTMIGLLVAAPSGSVFTVPRLVGTTTTFTVNGESRPSNVVEIDAIGAATTWRSQALFSPTLALSVSPSGTLVVGAFSVPTTGNVARSALAAFDTVSGAAVSGPTIGANAAGVTFVRSVLGLGQTLYLSGTFDAVNGQPRVNIAAVDVATNTVLPWPAAGVPSTASLVLADGTWIYAYLDDSGPLRRLDASTGVLDPVWQAARPFNGWTLAVSNGQIFATRVNLGEPGSPTSTIGTLDPVTGTLRELIRVPDGGSFRALAVDGDTAYTANPVRDTGSAIGTVRAYDLRTGRPVSVPAVSGQLNDVVVVDGRLFVLGGTFTVGAATRTALAEVQRPGSTTAWDSGPWSLDGGLNVTSRGVVAVRAHGSLLVAVGLSTNGYRVAAFDLSGASVPSNLRSQVSGPNTLFTWAAMVPPPTGGYVIEGGFAAGQTAGALAVGNATSVVLPMPAGPAFIRVRPQGSTEVSNEIVAGCLAPPLPPTALTTTLTGTNLSLAWTPPAGAVTAYSFSAGTTAGSSNAATVALPGTQTSIGGTVPGGTFFARVTATNACGTSGPSGEVFFTIGAPDPLPAAPTNLAATVSGSTVSLSWTAPAGAMTGYVLEGGTGPGLANIGTIQLGAATSFAIPGAPPGAYALRVRAITSAGSGAPSSDVVAVVP